MNGYGCDAGGAKPRSIRTDNLRLVRSAFRSRGAMSIHGVSELTGLSKTTMAKLIAVLVEEGQLLSVGKGPSTGEGGKKPELFAFHSEYAYVVSCLFTPPMMRAALYDLQGAMLGHFALSAGERPTYQACVEVMARCIHSLLESAGVDPQKLYGIAVGCEGVIDTDKGLIHHPIHYSWAQGLPIGEDLRRALGTDTRMYIDNITRFFGYAEISIREQTHVGCTLCVFAGEMTGGSIITDHVLQKGQNGFVGEIGHLLMDADSKDECSCGSHGCFEALISPPNVLRRGAELAKTYPAGPLTQSLLAGTAVMEDVFAAAPRGDPLAQAILEGVIERFAALIHNAIMLIDPQEVIIQGFYASSGPYLIERLEQVLNTRSFYIISDKLRLSLSALDLPTSIMDSTLGGALYVADDFMAH